MFERFTDRARRAAILSSEEARKLNHNYIGTEHILLGLIGEGEGVAAKVLAEVGLDIARVRERVEAVIGRGQEIPAGHIPYTPRAKKVLELSLRDSLQLGHNYIGTEHILLGLLREGEGVGAQIIEQFAPLADVRQLVLKTLAGYKAIPTAVEDESEDAAALSPIIGCVALLNEMEPRHRRAALAYLNAWYAE